MHHPGQDRGRHDADHRAAPVGRRAGRRTDAAHAAHARPCHAGPWYPCARGRRRRCDRPGGTRGPHRAQPARRAGARGRPCGRRRRVAHRCAPGGGRRGTTAGRCAPDATLHRSDGVRPVHARAGRGRRRCDRPAASVRPADDQPQEHPTGDASPQRHRCCDPLRHAPPGQAVRHHRPRGGVRPASRPTERWWSRHGEGVRCGHGRSRRHGENHRRRDHDEEHRHDGRATRSGGLDRWAHRPGAGGHHRRRDAPRHGPWAGIQTCRSPTCPQRAGSSSLFRCRAYHQALTQPGRR